MSVCQNFQRVLVSNLLTLYYCIQMLIVFAIQYLKNPFSNPWPQKLMLVPPTRLTDPKYGVHKYIKVNNTKLHYVENGDPSKPMLLFVHGFPEFWYSWRHQILEFQKDYWCIAIDMRGYGDSERPEDVSAYHLDLLAEDVRDLIRQLGSPHLFPWVPSEPAMGLSREWAAVSPVNVSPATAICKMPAKCVDYSKLKLDTKHKVVQGPRKYHGGFQNSKVEESPVGREKCILVAHDWGGLVACHLREVYPDVLSGLVVLASTSITAWLREIWTNKAQRNKSWYVFLYRAPIIPEKMLLMNDLNIYDTVMLFPDKTSTDKEDIECYKYWFRKPYALTPAINYYRANFRFDLPDIVEYKENIPMIVAHASDDPFLSHSLMDTMKKQYACQTAIVSNTGHFLQQEDPETVNKLIKDFLTEHEL